ncbi:hypothetical protein BABINDRAFT_109507 [Babjeviella inositovora NRRL Y-12698]|uniref:Uncharacterized protein n=1 Tax=Babjeviella inositovora NRRL Y-12698 TaxID=984486 RepID=A0A1E3QVD6_9ASCO|nr:uncharacterized protein BABINDRAFT_109507 [Babjeviella inositovora NRRL Y-12698]ODQ81620.1 hypothetical protein BABINDRAFT_109507 [Babjeviella inositovora NRRL Y-12698]
MIGSYYSHNIFSKLPAMVGGSYAVGLLYQQHTCHKTGALSGGREREPETYCGQSSIPTDHDKPCRERGAKIEFRI